MPDTNSTMLQNNLSPGAGTVGGSTGRFRPTEISQLPPYLRKRFILFRTAVMKISHLFRP